MNNFFEGLLVGWFTLIAVAGILHGPLAKDVCNELKHYHPEIKLISCEDVT